MTGLVWRAVLPPILVVSGVVLLLAGLGTFAQVLLASAVVPDPGLLLRMVSASLGASLGLALPVGTLAGVLAGLRRLGDEGAWLGLRTLGVTGRRISLPVLALGLLSMVGTLWMNHFGVPMAKAALRDSRVRAASEVQPVEGQTLQLGPWAVALEADRLYFAGEAFFGSARQWQLEPLASGVRVQLEDGEFYAEDREFGARFGRLSLPVPLPGTNGKVQMSERPTPEMMEQLVLSASLGRDTYERWILYKRSLLPFCSLLTVMASVPLGLGRRPVPLLAGGMLLWLWGLVRILDQQVRHLGLVPASLLLLLGAAACCLPWLRWRDR